MPPKKRTPRKATAPRRQRKLAVVPPPAPAPAPTSPQPGPLPNKVEDLIAIGMRLTEPAPKPRKVLPLGIIAFDEQSVFDQLFPRYQVASALDHLVQLLEEEDRAMERWDALVLEVAQAPHALI